MMRETEIAIELIVAVGLGCYCIISARVILCAVEMVLRMTKTEDAANLKSERMNKMIFRTIDDKLADMGFVKIEESTLGARYERYNQLFHYTQCVDISYKDSGRHIIQSYDKDLLGEKEIGNCCVGMTGHELRLFLKKMRKMGLYSRQTVAFERLKNN